MNLPLKPRVPIEALMGQGDLEALLRKAGELHGHFCLACASAETYQLDGSGIRVA